MESNHNGTAGSPLQEFFVTALQEMYWAETNLVNVLHTMANVATTNELREAFELHARQTNEHARQLEQVFALLALDAQPEPCVGLQGLFDEGWQVIDETLEGTAQRDVALIIAAQKVEHYEIATYGSLITLAKTMGQQEIANLLGGILDQEKETDTILTSIAEAGINVEATQETVETN